MYREKPRKIDIVAFPFPFSLDYKGNCNFDYKRKMPIKLIEKHYKIFHILIKGNYDL